MRNEYGEVINRNFKKPKGKRERRRILVSPKIRFKKFTQPEVKTDSCVKDAIVMAFSSDYALHSDDNYTNTSDRSFKEHYQLIGIDELDDGRIAEILGDVLESGDETAISRYIDADGVIDEDRIRSDYEACIIYRANVNNVYKDIREAKCPKEWKCFISPNPLKSEVVSVKRYYDALERGMSTKLISTGKNYLSSKGYKTALCEKNVFALRNFVIRIDFDKSVNFMNIKTAKAAFDDNIEKIFAGIPLPDVEHFIDDGYELWWCVDEFSRELEWLYHKTLSALIDKLNENLRTLDLCCFVTKTTRDPSTRFRLFGSRSRGFCEASVGMYNYWRKTIHELSAELGIACEKSSRKHYSNPLRDMLKSRVKTFEQYAQICDLSDKERKYDLVFLMYNTLIQLTDKIQAKNYIVNNFNKTVKCSHYILQTIFDRVDAHGPYQYTNEKIIEKLGMTKEECDALLFYKYDKVVQNKLKSKRLNERRKSANRIKKAARDKKILDVYFATLSYAEAAKAVGVCPATVKSVVEANFQYLDVLKKRQLVVRDRLIFNNYLNYGSFKKAAKAGKCSVRTAKAVICRFMKLRETLENKLLSANVPDAIYERLAMYGGRHTYETFKWVSWCLRQTYDIDRDLIQIALAPYLRFNLLCAC